MIEVEQTGYRRIRVRRKRKKRRVLLALSFMAISVLLFYLVMLAISWLTNLGSSSSSTLPDSDNNSIQFK
jgi:hypothetical protein